MRQIIPTLLGAALVLTSCPTGTGGGTGIPDAPASLTATATSSTSVRLTWPAAAGATGYALERRVGSGSFAALANPTGTDYADAGLNPQTLYAYRIKATKGVASSAWRESNSVTTP